MALPTTFKVLTEDQSIFEYTNAVAVTWKPTELYDSSTYRNLFPNQQVVLNPKTLLAASSTDETNTVTLQSPGTVAGTLVNTDLSTVVDNNSKTIVDDSVAAIEPHPWLKIRTLVEFWDSTSVGEAMTLTASLTSGNATIVVPNNRLLTPGQAISGTGIPVGAKIMKIPVDSPTTAILTHKATATADAEATLTGSNRVGYYYADEGLGGAEGVSILT